MSFFEGQKINDSITHIKHLIHIWHFVDTQEMITISEFSETITDWFKKG